MIAVDRIKLGAHIACSVVLAMVAVLAAGATAACVALVFLAVITPSLVQIDLSERRLPNRLVYPALIVGIVTVLVEWMNSGTFPIVPVVAAAACAGFLLVLCVFGGMGMGDVKLSAALGLASWLPTVAVLSPVVAFLLGGVVSVTLLARGRRGGTIAFGPFLLAGFWIAVALEAWARLAG